MKKMTFWVLMCWQAAFLRAEPATVLVRVPAGTAVPAQLPALLSQWRLSGQVSRVLFLTDGKPETAGHPAQFAAFAVIEFSNEAAMASWQKTAAPQLPSGLIVRPAQVLAHHDLAKTDSGESVFVVNTYTPIVSRKRFAEFASGYTKPLYDAMQGTQALVSYSIYLELGPLRHADAINVLEYRNAAALASMGKLKGGIRERLTATVPTYAHFDKIKDTLRLDGHGTFATYTPVAGGDGR
jgi:hypothetical protein